MPMGAASVAMPAWGAARSNPATWSISAGGISGSSP